MDGQRRRDPCACVRASQRVARSSKDSNDVDASPKRATSPRELLDARGWGGRGVNDEEAGAGHLDWLSVTISTVHVYIHHHQHVIIQLCALAVQLHSDLRSPNSEFHVDLSDFHFVHFGIVRCMSIFLASSHLLLGQSMNWKEVIKCRPHHPPFIMIAVAVYH